ncbi:RNA polymerase sigma factor [Chitinophaga silvisoli]|uniref:RNA polymerase sigma-70 factor n=1 Tax=Chitinophaga silvisoli TaxID=2291814 RepID=A0A3E1P8T2_9BACT|nr:RNA polymerase sigma-70 factor [Chitinophaga silvisoli]RFM36592.1 RNA polymerase sigma-70 factor [Chitinophaga silvisoli]
MESIINNDQILATRLKNGDHSAFEELYATYHQLLYSVAFKYLKSAAVAEDAVHETFVRLWTHRDRLDPLQGVRNYLFKTLKFHILNLIRNNKRMLVKNYEISYNAGEIHQETESAIIFNDYKKVVDTAINSLSAQKKHIFKMKSEEGLSNEEVAQRLGLSINTVKFQYSQASKALKSVLKVIFLLSVIVCKVFFS